MISVRKSGFFTTLQDAGRFGYRHLGVPVSGVMDRYAARRANSLLENQKGDALLEITMTGPELEFHEPTYIALAGADMSAKLNGESIGINEVHEIEPGDILSFGQLKKGLRVYLAIKGGFQTASILNSRSFYKPITEMNRIREHMELPYTPCDSYVPKIMQVKPDTFWKRNQLQVYPGPEFDLLDDKQLEGLFVRSFTIAKENNRMAYQLEEHLSPNIHSMLTSATLPGTVQLTPAGKIIILMVDGQTTGGYPRILQLSEGSINLLAQKKHGDKIEFVIQK
ncbi:biotin-dependent carboxyltransferase family protein [Lentiprolixibacter aurantiacus]|uniref:Biotin-dependent carboxyltransferase family protein n=1 Tax=Lentiprolixibacter aurantiacus TaxID=2993939 RepID=A0AAE3MM38_9FLAO|nr:biotin-dependent carboxyltransferase family protein [Lentiprolixibacter aurantiacus]MCX2719708.1 biotin-dependent carboxyltransferase family protein [Lentiprolixibacter aurantiacus]